MDLVAGHCGDAGQLLAVEQYETADNAVDGGDVFGVQKLVGQLPVVLFIGGGSSRTGSPGQGQSRRESTVGAPAEEVRDLAAQCRRAGQ